MYLFKLNRVIGGKIVSRTCFEFFSTMSRAKANATMESYKDLSVKSASIFFMRTDGEMELVACRIYVPFLGVKARNWFTPEKFIEVPEEKIEGKPREPERNEWREGLKNNLIQRMAELGTIATQLAK